MSVQILADEANGGAAFFCSTSQFAFGPLMPDRETAEAFSRTFSRLDDPRSLTDAELEARWYKFHSTLIDHCPMGHEGKVEVDNLPDGVTHFTCYQKGCRLTWGVDGSLIEPDEED